MTTPVTSAGSTVLDKWKKMEETHPTQPTATSGPPPLSAEAKKQLGDLAVRAVDTMMTAKVYGALRAFDVTVGARTIHVPFRMNGGRAVPSLVPPARDVHPWVNLQAELAGSKLSQKTMSDVVSGRGTPAQIAEVTRELARLHPNRFDATKSDEAVREYLRACGVGIDCAGFVQQALCMVKGVAPSKLGLLSLSHESLAHLASNPHFTKVGSVSALRPGDVITLKPPIPGKPPLYALLGEPGHTVLVAKCTTTKATFSSAAFEVKPGDPLVRVEVVSSFGQWPTGPRTETWVYNERTGKWGTVLGSTIKPSGDSGPYDHELDGMFHAK